LRLSASSRGRVPRFRAFRLPFEASALAFASAFARPRIHPHPQNRTGLTASLRSLAPFPLPTSRSAFASLPPSA
jgi:hypothetical protein